MCTFFFKKQKVNVYYQPKPDSPDDFVDTLMDANPPKTISNTGM